MVPSLSDGTKKFIAVCAVLCVAVCNVVFGMEWASERPAARQLAVIEPPVTANPAVEPAASVPPAGGLPIDGNAAPPAKSAPPLPGVRGPDSTVQIMAEPAAGKPKCDIIACAQAYRTFTASDCTYAPSLGERRLCTKGTPPQ
jgi:hypothetical protein